MKLTEVTLKKEDRITLLKNLVKRGKDLKQSTAKFKRELKQLTK